MSTPLESRPPDWRDGPEVDEAVQRFVTILERTLEHVTARRLVTARFFLTPTTVLRVLVGVPTGHLRVTVSAVARIQSYLSDESRAFDDAKAELETLFDFWTEGWRS